jgi:hypothetical protein
VHEIVGHLAHLAVDPAGGDHVVTRRDRVLHRRVGHLPAARGHDEEQPDGAEDQDQDQEAGH